MPPEFAPENIETPTNTETAVFEPVELWLAHKFESLQVPNAANIAREHVEDGTYDQAINKMSSENNEVQ